MISPEQLRRYPVFGFMDDAQVKAIAMIAEEKTYQEGEIIVEVNTPADALFFLEDGSVSYFYVVTSEHDPYYKKEYFISNFNPGEIFGISALIEPFVFTSTARADKVCHIIQINASALRALCEVDLKLSYGLMKAIAKASMERLQQTRVQLIASKD